MKKGSFGLLLLSSLLISLLFVGFAEANFIPMATPTPAVIIKADGTVSPDFSPINRTGNVYSLTEDIVGYTLVIERNNAVIDGAGYSIKGTDNKAGVFLQERNGITLQNLNISGFTYGVLFTWYYYGASSHRSNAVVNCTLSNNTYGIHLNDFSSGNTLTGNTATNNTYGIYLGSCGNNTLRSNRMDNNTPNFFTAGSYSSSSTNDIDTSNMVNGKPIVYLVNQQGGEVPADAGYIAMFNCKDLTLQGFNLSGNGQAMLLVSVSNVTITHNSIEGNGNGIWLVDSQNNTITENLFSDNKYNALYLQSSNSNKIEKNMFLENGLDGTPSAQVLGNTGRAAIRLSSSSNNLIIQNTLTGNGEGIDLQSCNSNLICQNNITATSGIAIGFFECAFNNVTENRITQSTDWAIRLWYSTTQNTVNANYIDNNSQGILLDEAEQNRILQNTVINNTGWGIQLKSASDHFMTASNNTITQNNFIGNQQEDGLDVSIPGIWAYPNGYVEGVGNFWDNGEVGNYWGDYQTRYSNASEVAGAGIWDTPWVINSNNIDHCPAVKPFNVASLEPPQTEKPTPTPSPSPSASPTPSTSPEPTQTTPPTAAPSPSVPEFPSWAILFLLVALASSLLILKRQANPHE
ncbi:MAG: right-handed parallel beta-helix repeat-containing protein [Candidatus Bathyarchaeota archaeon]|nr:right-handed parallel beta-helix repeat-containing protein [Candidatus Bathyarchaeota archaeon]